MPESHKRKTRAPAGGGLATKVQRSCVVEVYAVPRNKKKPRYMWRVVAKNGKRLFVSVSVFDKARYAGFQGKDVTGLATVRYAPGLNSRS
jgi:DUF1365 family protein